MNADNISKRHRWILFTLLFLASAQSFMDRQVLSVLAPQMMEEFSMSNTVYSRVVFAFVLSYTIMFGLGGRVLDAVGTRLGLGLSIGFWSTATILHSVTTGPWSLGAVRAMLGIGEGPCIPGIVKGAVEWSTPKQRALAIGFANAGSSFGSLLAPPLTVWCALLFGWRGTFVIMGLTGFVWLVPWYYAVRKLPPPRPQNENNSNKISFGSLLRRKPVRRLLAARFCFDPVFYFYMFWIPQYLTTERGMSLERIGALFWIPFFGLGLAQIIAGRVSDMFVARGRAPQQARLTLLLFAALATPSSWLASLAGTPGMAIFLMTILMFAHGFWIANYITLVSDTVAPAEVGTAIGLSGTCGGIVGMLSSLAIGPVVDSVGFGPVFLVSALLYPLAWIILRTGYKLAGASPVDPGKEPHDNI
jgi:ACS family hexuronate transporter-like MFS transporter